MNNNNINNELWKCKFIFKFTVVVAVAIFSIVYYYQSKRIKHLEGRVGAIQMLILEAVSPGASKHLKPSLEKSSIKSGNDVVWM